MGIKNKTKKANLDFEYECELKNSSEHENYEVRFHQSDEYGDTITFIQNGQAVGYSAKMLVEVVDFLRNDRGLLDGGNEANQRVVSQNNNAAVVNTGLPLPQVITQQSGPQVDTPSYYQRPEVLDVAPVQSFSPPSTVPASPSLAVADKVAVQEEIDEVPETPDELKEEAQKTLQERALAVAKAKAKASNKTLKRTFVPDPNADKEGEDSA